MTEVFSFHSLSDIIYVIILKKNMRCKAAFVFFRSGDTDRGGLF